MTKIMNHVFKIRLIAWLLLFTLFLLSFIYILLSDVGLNTNILDLLPKTSQNTNVETARQLFLHHIGNKVVFLIGNPQQATAISAANQFYKKIKGSSLISKIEYTVNTSQQESWARLYFPYRLSLLSATDQKLLEQHKVDSVIQNAIMTLYNPISVVSSSLLEKDPYFIFQQFLTSLPKPANIELIKNRPVVHSNKLWYVVINAQLSGNSFSLKSQDKFISLFNQAKTAVQNAYRDTQVLQTGLIFYAKAGADTARQQISTIGIGSIIGIFLLVYLTFRSLYPLALTLLSTASGFIAAFVVVKLYFSSVYLFTLVFGASLIGISVDYAFFYLSDRLVGGHKWNAQKGLKNIITGISLGLLNVVIAYLLISITPFPGLKQLAMFAIVGLTMSFATVVCLFPYLLKTPIAETKSIHSFILPLTNAYLKAWKALSKKSIALMYGIILILAVIGISQLTTNDDIHNLESPPVKLQNMEKDINEIMGNTIGNRFFIIQDPEKQQVLNKLHQLTVLINAEFPNVAISSLSLSDYLPSISQQQNNYELYKSLLIEQHLTAYLQRIGMSKQEIHETYKQLNTIKFVPLTVDDWLNSASSRPLRFLWLGNINHNYTSVLLLSNEMPSKKLQQLTQKIHGISFIDQSAEVSHVFSEYREHISKLVFLIYCILFLFLLFRYGLSQGMKLFLPPLFAGLISLAVLGYLSIPLTLFNLLALILVLGISTDYVLFFAETYSNFRSTMLATFLSAISTILSFGLLSLSSTPVIHDFGITVLVGITSAFILSPSVINQTTEIEANNRLSA